VKWFNDIRIEKVQNCCLEKKTGGEDTHCRFMFLLKKGNNAAGHGSRL
jgi:hypothetical protein